ncbi:MAG: hypothetical protein EBS35_07685, partial [Bacteroidetes bacterium]|nr:hypothetical protein [Bacteroidota bacterium]
SGRFGRKGVAINFVTAEDIRLLKDIEQFYSTQIDEMPMNVGDLLLTGTPGGVVVKAPSKFIQGIATWLLSNEKKVAAFRKKKNDYLKDGDVIKTHISSPNGAIDLGFQSNTIIPYQF